MLVGSRRHKDFDASVVSFVAVQDIETGCEITVDYTDGGTNELWFRYDRPPESTDDDRHRQRSP